MRPRGTPHALVQRVTILAKLIFCHRQRPKGLSDGAEGVCMRQGMRFQSQINGPLLVSGSIQRGSNFAVEGGRFQGGGGAVGGTPVR